MNTINRIQKLRLAALIGASLFSVNLASAEDILDFMPSILSATDSSQRPITDAQGNRCTLSENQQIMLTLHNQARTAGRVCGGVQMAAVPALEWNCTIASTATAHSVEMQANGDLSHTGNNGSNAGNRLLAGGYSWNSWGENIASGRTSASGTMAQWLGSTSHCQNLMSAGFGEIGVAPDSSVGNYWTAVFATR